MKYTVLFLFMAAAATAAAAQTTAKPAAPATAVHHAATTTPAAKLPAGVPVVRGIVKSAFTLRYEDIKLGTGADAEPGKMFKVLYSGYLGSNGRPDDGHKFDSSDDHRQPLKDKDGKPVMGDDGKPKLGDAQPMAFPQGMGRLIPGFDQGFNGMKVGGKRRLFIPWQLAYGAKGRPGPDAAHPGIPPKADLIFDVELVDVADMPAPPSRPGMPPGGRPMPPGAQPQPSAPGAAPAPGAPAPPAGAAAPKTPAGATYGAAPTGAPPKPAAPPTPSTTPAPSTAPAPAAPAAPATAPAPATPTTPQPH
ncbi:MAG TPA: FKBP-type peptidyl-prolyl cis-trans isomerase [Terracidiphilus sp.]|nr:FKBP-type peptidyl-prolyl cis-trans isomerase [Terracidiphilus sp.]